MTPDPSHYQYYVSGQLKTNVQSRLDYLSGVFLNLSELVQQFDSENQQMKEFISILLHFKYMLTFLRTHLVVRDDELFKQLGTDAAILLKTDLKQCTAKFNQLIGSSGVFEFVTEKDAYYASSDAYCSYNPEEDCDIRISQPKQPQLRKSIGRHSEGTGFWSQPGKQGTTLPNSSVPTATTGNLERDLSDSDLFSPIKLEPDVELVELDRSGGESVHSSDDCRNEHSRYSLQQSTSQDRASSTGTATTSNSNHRSKEKSNSSHHDLKMTIVTTAHSSRKVVKRSLSNYQDDEQSLLNNHSSNSNNNHHKPTNDATSQGSHKMSKSAKSHMYAFERQSSQDEDYDFDYEREDYQFDDDDYQAALNQAAGGGQYRCSQGGCTLSFDSGPELNEHLLTAHFGNSEMMPTFGCLVEGCTEKFPNFARANVHMKNSHPESYITCEQCQKQVKAHYLRKHIYMRHRKGEYKCSQDDCGYVAEFYHELEKHRYVMHYNRYSWGNEQGGSGVGGGVPVGSGALQGPPGSNPIVAAVVQHSAQASTSSATSSAANSEDGPRLVRRFACKYRDCKFTHESANRVLKHIRSHHLGSSSSRNGLPVNPLSLDDRAANEYLDVLEFADGSGFYGD